jgi:DNA-binding LacI/PurR family transcriptional regulator
MNDLPQRVSLRDIAKKLGVSHATVSMALRDHPRITEAVREKVQAAACEMGYHPDAMLTALARYRKDKTEQQVHSVIAWLNCWQNPRQLRSHREFELYWKGASAAAQKFGYRVEEFTVNDQMLPRRLEQVLLTRGINGILLPPQPRPMGLNDEWSDFHWENFSVIRFGRSWTMPNAHVVTSDQVGNTILACAEIRRRGYRRLGYIAMEGSVQWMLYEAGYLVAQKGLEPGMKLPMLTITKGAKDAQINKLNAWIKKHRPDAILTDVAAVRGMLEGAGYRVPEDIGLAAQSVLDGNADAGIYQNPEEIGRVAFLVVMSLINDNAQGVPPIFRQVLISGKWVDGSSLPARNVPSL